MTRGQGGEIDQTAEGAKGFVAACRKLRVRQRAAAVKQV